MSSRNNPISVVQKKRTASTTPKKRTVSSSRPSRAPKKAPVKQHYSMPGWLRNILAVAIVGCFSVVFYYFFIRPYAYRWKPCNGLKEYGVCIPSGYDIHGIDISHYQGKIDWGRLLQNKQTATPLHFIFMKATEGGDHNDTTFQTNFANARNHGFIRGAYHFYIPGTDALKQAATEALKLIVGFPCFPFLVVMIMTPLADLAPYTAAAEASFSTSICPMS